MRYLGIEVDDALEISEQTEISDRGVYWACHSIAEPKAKRSAGVPVLPARDRLTHKPMAAPWSDFGIALPAKQTFEVDLDHELSMKNIQVIDRAANCVYDIFK